MKNLQTLRKNKKKGFTLVEIIVVLVIIAILMAALAPVVIGWIQEARDTALIAEGTTARGNAQAVFADCLARGTAVNIAQVTAATSDPTTWLHTTQSGQDFNELLGATPVNGDSNNDGILDVVSTPVAPYVTGSIQVSVANNQITQVKFSHGVIDTARTATWTPAAGWTVA